MHTHVARFCRVARALAPPPPHIAALIMWKVVGSSGACRVTTSLCVHRSSSVVYSAPSSRQAVLSGCF